MDTAQFAGRKALRLVKHRAEGVDGFLPLPGVDFQDGTIDADVAVKIANESGRSTPGFIGIAFRARADASSYDMFYIRPGAAGADDQATRNQVAQYCAAPGYDWYALRRAWPAVYESHADVHLDAWTHITIEVSGRTARLFLNRNPEPTLVSRSPGLERLEPRGLTRVSDTVLTRRRDPCGGGQHHFVSNNAFSAARSLRFARRIAADMNGATIAEKPEGLPRFRGVN